MPEVRPDTGFGRLFVDWIAGVVLIYAALFAVGSLIFGDYPRAVICAVVAAAAVGIIHRDLTRRGFLI